ncbi:hypothetical protein [Longimicrobium sp.]|uniref:hypothetical protein n=1 Tax=Longimicrobium sp. TaxID=2029185 RepID=UPI002E2FB066|nr:hypothetical protein [Longimicrobium sp.]HEX6037953.1 hypothetical protein [Longimicrobium sp.]
MTRISPSAERAGLHPRFKLILALTAVAALLVVLQQTALAPLPHSSDSFLGGIAAGLAVSTVIAWFALRD